MEEVAIPTIEEIGTMSRTRCQSERIRLKNEISFARGNATWGGPSNEAIIAELKQAVDTIERRLSELSGLEDNHCIGG